MAALPFPASLPEFQQLFPDDTACAKYLEALRWGDGFACEKCGVVAEPYRFAARPGVLRCRDCATQTSDCRPPIADCRLPTADLRPPTTDQRPATTENHYGTQNP